MNNWAVSKPGIIERQQYIDAKNRHCEKQNKYRKLERPYRDIIIPKEDFENCVSKIFVEQILAIRIMPDDLANDAIKEAMENFIRFYTENSRLLEEGEITDKEWGDFFNDLKRRWENIRIRNAAVIQPNVSRDEIGRRTYFDTLSPDYKAPLDGQDTTELYLTHGGMSLYL